MHMVHVPNVTLIFKLAISCHDYLCQIIMKSHQAGQSCGLISILGAHNTHTQTGAILYALSPFHGGGIKLSKIMRGVSKA